MNKQFTALALSILFSTQCFAGDLIADLRQGITSPKTENGGFFELGLAAGYIDSAEYFADINDEAFLSLVVAGDYYYHGFFIEANNGSADGINLGYNLLNQKNWAVDIIAASISGEYSEDSGYDDLKKKPYQSTADKLELLEDRNSFYAGAGLRVTGYFDNIILQYRLLTDVYKGNGIVSTLRLGQSWQYENINFHGVISAKYHSAETNQYWYGITADETVNEFTQYKPNSSINYTAEVGATYAFNENWVYRGALRYRSLAGEVKSSPLIEDNHESLFINTLTYVF